MFLGQSPSTFLEGHSPLTIPTAAAGLLGAVLPVHVGGVLWGVRNVHSFPFVTGVAKKILATFVSPLWAAVLAALAFLTLRSALLRKEHSLHLALQVGSMLRGLLDSRLQLEGAQPEPLSIALQPSLLLFSWIGSRQLPSSSGPDVNICMPCIVWPSN